jgi:hypothetical protein
VNKSLESSVEPLDEQEAERLASFLQRSAPRTLRERIASLVAR